MKQAQLVEPTVIQTSVPFPAVDLEASKEAGNVVLGKHETDTIVVESASELVTVSIQTSLFRTRKGDNSALDIVHDANGRPMIFSVGSDGVSFPRSHFLFFADVPAWKQLVFSDEATASLLHLPRRKGQAVMAAPRHHAAGIGWCC